MANTPDTKFRVAIIGAGLGGLLVALLLQKQDKDMNVEIYEASHKLTELGAGVGMWPRVWEIMQYLGLEDELVKITGGRDCHMLPMDFRKADEEKAVDIHQFTPSFHSVHRSELQTLLVKNLRSADKIHYHKRLISYVDGRGENEPIVLHFQDGSTATCNVLIGSDGIRSAVRRTMFSELANEAGERGLHEEATKLCAMADPVWSGQVAYRGLVPTSKLSGEVLCQARTPSILLGKNKNVVCFPISHGEITNVVAFLNTPGGEGSKYDGPWVSATTGDEVAKQFATWDPNVQTLLKAMNNPLAWAVHTVSPLPTFVKGRVVLTGDAAHAMTPHQGAGAGQAFEDGFILAMILAHPSVTLENLPEALKIHDKLRRPFAQGVQRRSQMNGALYHLNRLGWEDVTAEQSNAGGFSQERLTQLGEELEQQMEWQLHGSIMGVQDEVSKMLKQLTVC